MLLHTLIMVVVPNFNFHNKPKKRQVIEVALQKLPPPAPVIEELPPIEIPEPPKPKPPPPIKKKVKPIVKPKPVKTETPAPIELPVETTPPPVEQEIIAVPANENPTETVVPEPVVPVVKPDPAPVTPPPPQISQADIDSAKAAYSRQLGRSVKKHLIYPKRASRRGLQGTTLVKINVDRNGNVLSVTVSKSSGHSSLDKRALETVKKASPLPSPPNILEGDSISINMPIIFELKN